MPIHRSAKKVASSTYPPPRVVARFVAVTKRCVSNCGNASFLFLAHASGASSCATGRIRFNCTLTDPFNLCFCGPRRLHVREMRHLGASESSTVRPPRNLHLAFFAKILL